MMLRSGLTTGITGPGSGTSALVTYMFKPAGMNAAPDATEVSLGSNPITVPGALKSGQAQALAFFQPTGQETEAEGIGSIYISPSRGDIPALNGDVHGGDLHRRLEPGEQEAGHRGVRRGHHQGGALHPHVEHGDRRIDAVEIRAHDEGGHRRGDGARAVDGDPGHPPRFPRPLTRSRRPSTRRPGWPFTPSRTRT